MITASVLFGIKINDIKTEPSPTNTSNESIDLTTLTLRLYDGDISLFEGNSIIETFYDVNFSTLPAGDQSRLIEGIRLDNIEDAYRLVEDFDG